MSDLRDIKNRIYDEELIVDILKALDCEYISTEQNGNLFTAQLPSEFNSTNKRAVQVKNKESLTAYIRNRGISGDIFAIVGYILFDCKDFEQVKENLVEIKAWVCNLFEWNEYLDDYNFTIEKPKKKEWNKWLKPFLSKKKNREQFQKNLFKEHKPVDKRIMNRFVMKPHVEFYKSGINYATQNEFEIGFCLESQRVIYPIYDNNGIEIIGIKGRYVGNNKRVAEEKKYLYLIPCDKSVLLFNLHRAKPFIEEQKEVIVFESAKSCMLAYQYGYKNTVSIEGNELSNIQAFLLKQLNVTITLCFDKDMTLEFVQKQARLIRNRISHAIIDKEDYLSEKDSPVDKGKRTWEYLYQNHKYDLSAMNHSIERSIQK